MMRDLFKKTRYITVTPAEEVKVQPPVEAEAKKAEGTASPYVPDGLWVKCGKCDETLYRSDLEKNGYVCPVCQFHFRLDAHSRINQIIDFGTFTEFDKTLTTQNVLDFPKYDEKVRKLQITTGISEAVVTGLGKIHGKEAVIGVMDSRFLMGSMGAVVGEKVTRAVEQATALKVPVILFTASGGARMQEGIISLMQMAKTSAALKKHSDAGLLYITVLTDPTTGGVTASYAMLGDIIIAEPGALIGFAGPRVIEQTIGQKLPDGFQQAEFLKEHGFVDQIVMRKQMKQTLATLINLHSNVVEG